MLIWGLSASFSLACLIFFPSVEGRPVLIFITKRWPCSQIARKYEEFLLLQIPQAQTKVIRLELILSEQPLFHAGLGCSLSIK